MPYFGDELEAFTEPDLTSSAYGDENESETSDDFVSADEKFQREDSANSKRKAVIDLLSPSPSHSEGNFNSLFNELREPKRRKPNGASHSTIAVIPPPLVFPKSKSEGWAPPLEKSQESRVLQEFLELGIKPDMDSSDGDEFNEHNLENFRIYRPSVGKHSDELVSLEHINIEKENIAYYFDGVLEENGNQRYVEQRPIRAVNVGGYRDLSQHTNGSELWLQSHVGQNQNDTWYRLQWPASDYRRFHEPFVWLAGFSKHFVDYLLDQPGVTLRSFRDEFGHWADRHHGSDAAFRRWRAEFGLSNDFRQVIATHTKFLHRESASIDPSLEDHPIWTECRSDWLDTVPEEVKVQDRTVVTPFVEKCFAGMPWADRMVAHELAPQVSQRRRDRIKKMGFRPKSTSTKINLPRESATRGGAGLVIGDGSLVHVGDVVEINSRIGYFDAHSKMQSLGAFGARYGYIQGFTKAESGIRVPRLLWIFDASLTTCRDGTYPFPNEVFLTDQCNCCELRLTGSQILRKVSVSWFSNSLFNNTEFFIRAKFRRADAAFVTASEDDLSCRCNMEVEDQKPWYSVGDTVLVQHRKAQKATLEPMEIVGLLPSRSKPEKARVRRLLRRRRDYADQAARPNELVYTDRLETVSVRRLVRKCHIRIFDEKAKALVQIPAPYSRDGTADAYYITSREGTTKATLLPAHPSLIPHQGFDPTCPPATKTLAGLDLFCGGGNFGRGIEEGGAVEIKAAIDFNKSAIHTYRANLQNPDVLLFCQSVDDFLAKVISGDESFPRIGCFNIIIAGSPCQGFSLMNNKKKNVASLNNISKIASVASFIDVYRPEFALLENVTGMASAKKNGEPNVFDQLMCCLVAMGYQVQLFRLDAWSFGSPQSRERLFISIAAPGLKLPPPPPLTHSHPEQVRSAKLGQLAGGDDFGKRRFDEIPAFGFVTAQEATRDLPPLLDGHTLCVPFPDHRVRIFRSLFRNIMHNVPKAPYKQGLYQSIQNGWQGQLQVDMFEAQGSRFKKAKNNKAWVRIDPSGLMGTIMTDLQPYCAFAGRLVHWKEDRLISLMEARRAQSMPDDEVLIGSYLEKWKIVGNSVARSVAMALGATYREPWLAMQEVVANDMPTKVTSALPQALPRLAVEHQTVTPVSMELEASINEDTGSTEDEPMEKGRFETNGDRQRTFEDERTSSLHESHVTSKFTAIHVSCPVTNPARASGTQATANVSSHQKEVRHQSSSDIDSSSESESRSNVLPASRKANVSKSVRGQPRGKQITCSRCLTPNTGLWRRDARGRPLCNACGVYRILKGVPRPLGLAANPVKKRGQGNKNLSRPPPAPQIKADSSDTIEDDDSDIIVVSYSAKRKRRSVTGHATERGILAKEDSDSTDPPQPPRRKKRKPTPDARDPFAYDQMPNGGLEVPGWLLPIRSSPATSSNMSPAAVAALQPSSGLSTETAIVLD